MNQEQGHTHRAGHGGGAFGGGAFGGGYSATCAACALVLSSCSSCGFQSCPTLLVGKGLEGSLTAQNYIASAKPQYRCVACVKKFALSSDVKAFLIREYAMDEASMLFFEFYVEENKLLFQLVSGVLHYHDASHQGSLLVFAASVHAQRIAKLVVCQRSVVHRDIEFLAAKVHVLEARLNALLQEKEISISGSAKESVVSSSESLSGKLTRHSIRRTHIADDLFRFKPSCLKANDLVSHAANVDALKDWMRNIVAAYGDDAWGFATFTMFSDDAGIWHRGTVQVVWEYEREEQIRSMLKDSL